VGVGSIVIIDVVQTGMLSVYRKAKYKGEGMNVFLEGFGGLQNGWSSTIGRK
jgi:hypothetical protein